MKAAAAAASAASEERRRKINVYEKSRRRFQLPDYKEKYTKICEAKQQAPKKTTQETQEKKL